MLVGGTSARAFGLRGGIPMEAAQTNICLSISRASAAGCIACRHYAIDSNTYNPLTRQEVRGVDASFKGLSVHPTYKGEATGGNYVSRKEVTPAPLSIRELDEPTAN